MQSMQTSRRWRPSHVLIGLLLLAAGGYWVYQTVRRGSYSSDPGSATTIVSSKPADGERDVALDSKITATVAAGRTVDKDTLNPDTVRLYRAADGHPVPGLMLANSGGDEISFTPAAKLEPG